MKWLELKLDTSPAGLDPVSQLLEEQGCAISRRTVAKYRDELGIPSASGRKQLPGGKEHT